MWRIEEHRNVVKAIDKVPIQIVKKYELWKQIVFRHGPEKLREFPGFHDELLQGERTDQRSSRLSLQYRIIYRVFRKAVTVKVLEITPHEY
jgi:plasmid maintenance system killer protein